MINFEYFFNLINNFRHIKLQSKFNLLLILFYLTGFFSIFSQEKLNNLKNRDSINAKSNNEVLLDSTFINKATNPVFDTSPYYGYGWWLYNYNEKKVFTMNGHRGQFVIVFPEEDIIIVRLGDKNQEGDNDDGDLYKYISEGYNLATSID